MDIDVPVKQALLEQTVVLTLMIVLLSHVSMEHVLIQWMDTIVPVSWGTLAKTAVRLVACNIQNQVTTVIKEI